MRGIIRGMNRKESFEDELREFLGKAGTEYDDISCKQGYSGTPPGCESTLFVPGGLRGLRPPATLWHLSEVLKEA